MTTGPLFATFLTAVAGWFFAPSGETTPARVDYAGGYLFVQATLDGDRPRRFVLDLGAAQTAVVRGSLPAGAIVREEVPGGPAAHGAGGRITGIRRGARVAVIAVGGARVSDADVVVLERLPVLGGKAVDGILGLDVFRRAGPLSLVMPTHRTKPGRLTFSPAAPARPATAEIHLAVKGGVLTAAGEVNGKPALLVLDTGSPHSFITSGTARTAKVDSGASVAGLQGIDGAALPARQANVARLQLGGSTLRNLAFLVSDLPVLKKLDPDRNMGLLGLSYFAHFTRIDVDYNAQVMRLWR